MRLLGPLMAQALGACSSPAVHPLDGYEIELGFAVLLDEDGEPRWVSTPFGVERGIVTFGALPSYALGREDRDLLVLSLTRESIERRAPDFDADRASELALSFRRAEPDVYLRGPPELLEIPFPEDAVAYRAHVGGMLAPSAVPLDITLIVPIGPEACRTTAPRGLETFASEPRAVDTGTPDEDFVQVELIDDDRALALTNRALHLLVRGERHVPIATTTSAPGTVLGGELFPPAHHFARLYFDASNGTLWVAGTRVEPSAQYSLLVELRVGAGLEILGIAEQPGPQFSAVTVDDAHRPILADSDGAVWRYTDRFELHSRLDVDFINEQIFALIGTGDAGLPLMATSSGKVHLFEASSGAWMVDVIPRSVVPTVTEHPEFLGYAAAAARTTAGDLELWVAGSDNIVLRKEGGGPWEKKALRYPPRFDGCAVTGVYPRLDDNGGFDAIAVTEDRVFLTVRECSTILELDRRGSCVALTTVRDDPPVYSATDLQAIDVRGSSIVVAGEDGLVYSVVREE